MERSPVEPAIHFIMWRQWKGKIMNYIIISSDDGCEIRRDVKIYQPFKRETVRIELCIILQISYIYIPSIWQKLLTKATYHLAHLYTTEG